MSEIKTHAGEVASGDRFTFGENWTRFLSVVDNSRIEEAKRSLKNMLGTDSLDGLKFLDVGSGSGLFSLAARMLGAQVHSFDYDPKSVACTLELKRRYFPNDLNWKVEEGSILDRNYLGCLGKFDIVYSWGVLHHTGQMWNALENVALLADVHGRLFIAIYNDQGGTSRRWRLVKKIYCSGLFGRLFMKLIFYPYFALGRAVADLLRQRNPFKSYSEYKKTRGMSVLHDWVDWLGGYPFEVAKPEEIFNFYKTKGFRLDQLQTCGGGLGCNQFVFTRSGDVT